MSVSVETDCYRVNQTADKFNAAIAEIYLTRFVRVKSSVLIKIGQDGKSRCAINPDTGRRSLRPAFNRIETRPFKTYLKFPDKILPI
jgi:hypothetical protein